MVRAGRRWQLPTLLAFAFALVLTGCGPSTDPSGAGPIQTTAAEATPSLSTPTPSASPTQQPAKKPRSTTPSKRAPLLEKGDRGGRVRELQHRLHQLDWFSGSITGVYGKGTVRGVKGFQAKRGIARTGEVDHATWAALVKRTRKPTNAELHNRLVAGPAIMRQGSAGDRVRDLQARLKQIGWFSGSVSGTYGTTTASSVRGFQAKRQIPVTGEVDQRTLDRLRAMTHIPTSDELHNRIPKPSVIGLDPRCLTGRTLCISKRSNSLAWVIDGNAQLRVDVRFGSYETPTREGSFSVGWKSRNHVSTIYHTPMPYAMFFSGGQAVHYSPDFVARGYAGASHGCVNVRNLAGVRWLFDQVRVGDKVIVYR